LPDDIGRLQSLTTLDIDNSAVKEIPQSIVELTNLRRLALPCSYITRLPSKEAIQTIQHEQVRNELMRCHEGLEERQQEERKRAVGEIEYFTRETVQPRIERMSRKRITPKHLKKTLKFLKEKYGKKESERMLNESTAEELFGKYPREREREKFRRKQKLWRLNRGLAEQLRNEENSQIPAFPDPYASSPEISPVESSATPELTPDDEDAMDVVTSNNTSPASASSPVAAAAYKRERSSPESVDWTVGPNDNDNRPQKQSRKQAWEGGKRTKRRNRK
jgi:Leucine-rich repeat (LRR) protein